jgi:CBS domain containing-hemolysin-like protein
MFVFIVAVSLALIVSFACSIFESVLLSLSQAQVQTLVRDGKVAGRLFTEFKRRIDIPIAAILIINTIAHTIGAAFAGASYVEVFDPETLWIFTIVFTVAVLLLSEIIPKTLGVTYASRLATPVAIGIKTLIVALRPLVMISEQISRLLRGRSEAPVTSVEEIRLLAALGRSEGVVGARTANIIAGATHLGDLAVRDVILPRGEVVFLSGAHSRDEVLEVLQKSGHSRFPFVPSDELDEVTGVVLAKQLTNWMLTHPDQEIAWPEVVRDPAFVPESMALSTLLRTFKEARRHLAIVVDEYGSVEGIVTLEDVLEEMVGEIVDEHDIPQDDIASLPDGSVRVAGDLDLRRLCRHLGMEWHPDAGATTVSGLLMESLQRMPRVGDHIEWRGYRLTVSSMSKKRPGWVAVAASEEPDE